MPYSNPPSRRWQSPTPPIPHPIPSDSAQGTTHAAVPCQQFARSGKARQCCHVQQGGPSC